MSIWKYLQESLIAEEGIKLDPVLDYMSVDEFNDHVKKTLKPIPYNSFKYKYKPEAHYDLEDVDKLGGYEGEDRKWISQPQLGIHMFGMYTMSKWYELLKSIAEKRPNIIVRNSRLYLGCTNNQV